MSQFEGKCRVPKVENSIGAWGRVEKYEVLRRTPELRTFKG
jgi:hypothetical protein